ncbi:pseudouridine synthase [Caenimonas soli]|uniref:pseudouridine synthase n=1 Tax=Caenimonas soli TaxID=2735555 RepID=UPI0015544960|nr:pseudouridine synthase [Caenimonas soli]NPC58723.1 pseudouridine synthase [Caenimonas soli]
MLPTRDGVGPSQVALPAGRWTCMLDFLVDRFPAISAAEWSARMAGGNVVDRAGSCVAPEQPYVPYGKLYYYRTVPDEVPNAAQACVLFEDELLVVADKPHFLPVTPSGNYLQETLLVRLRRQLGLDALTPLHRLDRETAGVVLFAKQPATCAGYHALFADRAVVKSYQAIAPANALLQFPLTRTSTLVTSDQFMQMREAPDDASRKPNARTEIELMEMRGTQARYRLRPLTGKRHQLRVHMAALGLPILGDRIYPTLMPQGGDKIDDPLRLLAESIAFRDPVTGENRRFSSRQQLHFPAASLA